MDRRIEVKVFGNHLWKDGNRAGVQGEGNVTTLRISFDEGWDEYAKSITFFDAKGRNPVKRVLGVDLLEDAADNTLVYLCKIPPEPLTEAGWCSFIIEGYIDEARQRSVETQLEVMPARDTDDAVVPGAPTPTQAEQLQGEIQKIKDDVQMAAQGAQNAELAGQYAATAAESAQAAEESAEAAETAVSSIGTSVEDAAASAAAAKASETAAGESAEEAAESARAAAASETNAEAAAALAEEAKGETERFMEATAEIEDRVGNQVILAEQYKDDASAARASANHAAREAVVSAEAAEAAQAAAAASAGAAAGSEVNAKASEEAAVKSERSAGIYSVAASESFSGAKTAEESARDAQTAAEKARDEAIEAAESAILPSPKDIGAIPAPETAEPWQMLVVAAVDENGKPTSWTTLGIPEESEVRVVDYWSSYEDVVDAVDFSKIVRYAGDGEYLDFDRMGLNADGTAFTYIFRKARQGGFSVAEISPDGWTTYTEPFEASGGIYMGEIDKAVEEAKSYTDEKVKGLGKGDMLASVYDPAGLKKDIFLYIGEMTSDALTDARAYADELLEGAQVSSGGGVLECYLDQTEFWEVNDAYQSGSRVVLWDNNELWNLVYAETDVEYRFQNVSPDGIRTAYLTEEGWSNGYDEFSSGGSAYAMARIGWVELPADAWESNGNLHSQVVEIEGVTECSQVDLTPSVEQLAIFYEKDLTFVTENEDGVVTVYAIGQKPANDYTIQVTITEVEV